MTITFKDTSENGKDVHNVRCLSRKMEGAIISHVSVAMNFASSACLAGEMSIMNVWRECITDYSWSRLMNWVVFLHLCVCW